MDRSICDLRNKRLKIRYNRERHVKDVLGELIMYLLFVLVETLVCVSHRHRYIFYMNELIQFHFIHRTIYLETNVASTADTVFTIEDINDFMEVNIMTGLFGKREVKESNITIHNATETPEDVMDETPEIEPRPPKLPDLKKRRSIDHTYNDEDNNIHNIYYHHDDGDYNYKPPDIEPVPIFRNDRSSLSIDNNEYNVTGDLMNELNDMDDDNEDFEFFYKVPSSMPPLEELNVVIHPYNITPFQTSNGPLLQNRTFLFSNELLGAPRIRQIRSKPVDCWFYKSKEFNGTCYPIYSSRDEDKSPYYKGSKYYTIEELQTSWVFATINHYTGGGYVEHLTLNRTENLILLKRLKDINWIDEGSRLVMFEFNTLSRSTPLITQVQFIFEIPACGNVLPSYTVITVLKDSFLTTKSTPLRLLILIYYCFIMYYSMREYHAILKYKWRYILYTINWVDFTIITFAYAFLIYNFLQLKHMLYVMHQVGSEKFISVNTLISWHILYIDAFAVHLILVYMKIFHYINFTLTIAQLSLTVKMAIKELLCVIFIIVLFGFSYSISGILLFGNYHKYFQRLTLSLLALLRFILFDFQYPQIDIINPTMAPFYFLSFMIVVYFVILQMFLVIIMATYNIILKDDLAKEPKLFSYLFKHFRKYYKWFSKYFRSLIEYVKRRYKKIVGGILVESPKRAPHVRITELQPLGKNVLLKSELKETYLSKFEGPISYQKEKKKVRNLYIIRIKNRIALLDECITPLSFQLEDICRRLFRYIHMYEDERRQEHAHEPDFIPDENIHHNRRHYFE